MHLKKWRAASPSRSGGKWRSQATNLVSAERTAAGEQFSPFNPEAMLRITDYPGPGAPTSVTHRHRASPPGGRQHFSGRGRASQLAAAPVRPRGSLQLPEASTGCTGKGRLAAGVSGSQHSSHCTSVCT